MQLVAGMGAGAGAGEPSARAGVALPGVGEWVSLEGGGNWGRQVRHERGPRWGPAAGRDRWLVRGGGLIAVLGQVRVGVGRYVDRARQATTTGFGRVNWVVENQMQGVAGYEEGVWEG